MGSSQAGARFGGRLVLLAGYVTMLAAVGGYAVLSGDRRFVATGDSFPGTVTSVAELVGYFTATLSGALVIGTLVYVVTTASPDHGGVLDANSFRLHCFAERVSLVWLAAAAAMIPIQAANNSGVAVSRLISSGALGDALGASEMARGWIAVTICSGVVALALRFTVRWVWHAVLLIPSLIGVIAVPVSGNAGQGPNHDYATSSVIVFAFAVAVLTGVKVMRDAGAARRAAAATSVGHRADQWRHRTALRGPPAVVDAAPDFAHRLRLRATGRGRRGSAGPGLA